MLASAQSRRCVECGTPYEAESFHYWYGDARKGPAYFCDRGILCSPKCSLAHHRHRAAEGTLPNQPAIDLFDASRPVDPFKRR